MSSITFKRSMIQDEKSLMTFFHDKKQIKHIKTHNKDDTDFLSPNQAITIAKFIAFLSAAYFLRISSTFLSLAFCKNLSKKCFLLGNYFLPNPASFFTSQNILKTAMNMPKTDQTDIYYQTDISFSQLCPILKKSSEKVPKKDQKKNIERVELFKKKYFDQIQEIYLKQKKLIEASKKQINKKMKILETQKSEKVNEINQIAQEKIDLANQYLTDFHKSKVSLFDPGGICRGISEWFAFLYFNTLGSFENLKNHLIAITKEFETGAPRQASVLHAFNCAEEVLTLKQSAPISIYNEKASPLHNEFEQLTNISNGIYKLELQLTSKLYQNSILYKIIKSVIQITVFIFNDPQPKKEVKHDMIFIKQNDQFFIFDPSTGLINIKSNNNLTNFLNRYTISHQIIDISLYNLSIGKQESAPPC